MSDGSRRVQPAGRRSAGYPSLRAAWRILAGAVPLLAPALARGDATVPAPAHKSPEKPKLQSKGDIPAVQPAQRPAPKREDYPLPGGVAPTIHVEPPPPKPTPKGQLKPPRPLTKPPDVPHTDGDYGARLVPPKVIYSERGVIDAATGIVLHPHAPGEPCFKRSA